MGTDRRIRWRPLAAILAAVVAGIAVTRIALESDHQAANTFSMAIGVLGGALCFLWLVLFSRLPSARRRLIGFLGLGVAILFLASFRLRGVTGDLIPIFEWRWGSTGSEVPTASALPIDPVNPEVPEAVSGLRDFPQFFGPERDGKLPGPELARDWQSQPPTELWRREVGAGWSGFAVSGRHAVTLEQHGEEEVVVCYDVLSGDVLWVHRDRARYDNIVAGLGPRTTPTIEDDLVFTLGATGILNCLDLRSGELRWSVNIVGDNDATLPSHGVAGSPLVVNDWIVVNPGGLYDRSLVAYDKANGDFVWGGGSEPAEWSSPIRARIADVDQIVIFNGDVVGHDAENGQVLWSYPWKGGHPHICLPVVLPDDRLLISSGYGTGSELLQIGRARDRWVANSIWRSTRLKAKFTNVIALDGFVYGLDDGIMTCIDLADGSRQWKAGRYGHGQVLLVGDLLLVTTELGDVVLLDPSPEELRELTRFTAFDSKSWNPPALAGEILLLRNDREAACFRLPVRGE